MGYLYRFTAMDTWIKIQGITQNEILVRQGDLFWLHDGVTIDTVISSTIDPVLLQHGQFLGEMTRDQYRAAVRDKKLADCPIDAPVIKTESVQAPEHLAPLLRMGVRFF